MAAILRRCRLQAVWSRCNSSARSAPSEVLEQPLSVCGAANSSRRRMLSSGVGTEAAKSDAVAVRQQLEAAAREDRLDFFTAAKILFSTPPKPRTFGLDFHLWQFFVALLPPFAVYLTAQYARYEIRRMEKERDDAEELKRQTAIAEERAAQSADDEINCFAIQQAQTDNSKLKSRDEPVVVLPEKDFLAMKARLDAMEDKMKLLETARPGTTSVVSPESEATEPKALIKEDVQKPPAQALEQAEGGEGRQRTPEKQKEETPSEASHQRDLQASQSSGRSWFGILSKPEEKERSE